MWTGKPLNTNATCLHLFWHTKQPGTCRHTWSADEETDVTLVQTSESSWRARGERAASLQSLKDWTNTVEQKRGADLKWSLTEPVWMFDVPGERRNHVSPCNLLFGVAWVGLIPVRSFSGCFYKVRICKAALVDALQVERAWPRHSGNEWDQWKRQIAANTWTHSYL